MKEITESITPPSEIPNETSTKKEKDFTEIPLHVYFLIILAMIMTSFASILIRYAGKDAITIGLEPASASIIAFWRLFFATIGMFFGALVTRNLQEFKKVNPRGDLPLLTLSGLALAIHFVTWNLSLEKTNVASSITIVYLMPLFAIGFSFLFLKEKISWIQFGVILLTISGAIIVGVSDLQSQGSGSLIGDLFALAGAISGAGYFVIGRKKREKLDIFSYTTIVYGICTIFLLIYNLSLRNNFFQNLAWQHFLFFFLLALGPSCLGHTLYNYSLEYIRAPVITVTALGEMFGATLLAFLLFNELPPWLAFVGMGLVAGGILATVYLENRALRKQRNKRRKEQEKNNENKKTQKNENGAGKGT
ncbi:MAG: DMT family transporter [Asgard group archaeon]|nr:DMT family transporter [Asgard group archaeon]